MSVEFFCLWECCVFIVYLQGCRRWKQKRSRICVWVIRGATISEGNISIVKFKLGTGSATELREDVVRRTASCYACEIESRLLESHRWGRIQDGVNIKQKDAAGSNFMCFLRDAKPIAAWDVKELLLLDKYPVAKIAATVCWNHHCRWRWNHCHNL